MLKLFNILPLDAKETAMTFEIGDLFSYTVILSLQIPEVLRSFRT